MMNTRTVVLLLAATLSSISASAKHTEPVRIVELGDQKVRVYDKGKGPTLLLIHGMFGDYLDWEPVLEPLAKKHRVVALDLPGFGESSKPAVDYTAEFFTRNMDALLDKLKVKKATLVGNSFGGIVALNYAMARPERVEGLVLVDSGGFRKYTDQEREMLLQRFSEDNLRKLTPQINELMFTPLFVNGATPVRERYLAKQNAKLKRDDYRDYVHAIHSSIRLALDTYFTDQLKNVKTPTLFIQGEKDYVVQLPWVKEGSAQMPSSSLDVMPGCGHVPQLECVDGVVGAIEGFSAKKKP